MQLHVLHALHTLLGQHLQSQQSSHQNQTHGSPLAVRGSGDLSGYVPSKGGATVYGARTQAPLQEDSVQFPSGGSYQPTARGTNLNGAFIPQSAGLSEDNFSFQPMHNAHTADVQGGLGMIGNDFLQSGRQTLQAPPSLLQAGQTAGGYNNILQNAASLNRQRRFR